MALRGVSLPVVQRSAVSIIPAVLHTNLHLRTESGNLPRSFKTPVGDAGEFRQTGCLVFLFVAKFEVSLNTVFE